MRARSRSGRWQLWMLGGYALASIVLVAVWSYSLFVPITNFIEGRNREGMASVASATAVALQSSDLPASDVLGRIAETDDLRLTLIASDGTVLAESGSKGSEMPSHAGRPEVVSALSGITGYDRRVSKTDGIEYQYVAVPCKYEGCLVVVRVSREMEQIDAMMKRYLLSSLGLMACALSVALAVAWYAFRRAGAPVRQLESVRTDFVANASHELKTPVAGIRLLAETIGQAIGDGDLNTARTLSERLERESSRLQNLVADLMDLSRLEDTGRAPMAVGTCDLGEVVATSVEAHRARADEKGISLTLRDEMPVGLRVSMSATDATLVCDNLVGNAIAYTDLGSVEVSLDVDGADAVLEVRDTGVGIPYADQERVFERFYRVDTARSRVGGGTGLGLSLVRHAADRSHGTVVLRSKPDSGSTFVVHIPLACGGS